MYVWVVKRWTMQHLTLGFCLVFTLCGSVFGCADCLREQSHAGTVFQTRSWHPAVCLYSASISYLISTADNCWITGQNWLGNFRTLASFSTISNNCLFCNVTHCFVGVGAVMLTCCIFFSSVRNELASEISYSRKEVHANEHPFLMISWGHC